MIQLLFEDQFKAKPVFTSLIMLATILGISLTLSYLFTRAMEYYLHRMRPLKGEDYEVRSHLYFWLNIFLCSVITLNVLPHFVFSEVIGDTIKHALFISSVLSGLNILTRLISIFKRVLRVYIDSSSPDNYKQRTLSTQFQFIEKVIALTIWSLGAAAILWSFDSARTIGKSLLASAGLVGIVFGFAAQKSLSNLLAGFQIAFTQPMRLDDVVIVEGQWGKVEEITLTYVVVCLWDLRRLIVPINYFIEKPFENWTKKDSEILGYVFLYVDYALPLDELRKKFEMVLASTPLWNRKVKVMQVTDSTEKTMTIRALMSAADAPTAFDLRCYVREKLIEFIQEKYPHCLPKVRVDSESLAELSMMNGAPVAYGYEKQLV
jgi:small-conductance mechanosensitive channel